MSITIFDSTYKVPPNAVVKNKRSRRKDACPPEAHIGTSACDDQHQIDQIPTKMLLALCMQSEPP